MPAWPGIAEHIVRCGKTSHGQCHVVYILGSFAFPGRRTMKKTTCRFLLSGRPAEWASRRRILVADWSTGTANLLDSVAPVDGESSVSLQAPPATRRGPRVSQRCYMGRSLRYHATASPKSRSVTICCSATTTGRGSASAARRCVDGFSGGCVAPVGDLECLENSRCLTIPELSGNSTRISFSSRGLSI